MEGIPDSGSVFSSWQPVNVFTLFEVVWDASGDQYTNTSSVAALIPEYVETSVLTFTVQPGQVLLDNPGVTMLTESRGWQANFVAVPEPSSIALIVCGLGVTVYFWRKRLQEDSHKMNQSN